MRAVRKSNAKRRNRNDLRFLIDTILSTDKNIKSVIMYLKSGKVLQDRLKKFAGNFNAEKMKSGLTFDSKRDIIKSV